MPPPRPREEPERDPPPRPSRRLPWGPRRTSKAAPTRQDRTDRTQRSLVSTNRSGMGGHAPHGQHNASETRFVACPGKAEGRNEAERPPALQATPLAAQTGGTAHAPPPPSPPPGTRTRRTRPAAGSPHRACGPRGTEKGPHTRTPAPTTRGSRSLTARPVGGQSGEGERLTPDAPRNSRRHPPRGRPTTTPTTPSQVGGNRDRTAPPKHARRSKGPGQDTRRGTDHMERPYQRPVPGPREVRTPHHPGGGGADAAGARAHTHEGDTRGLQEGQPDRARGTHRPRGMAYQRARRRDTRTGRPATRSAEHAGRRGERRETQHQVPAGTPRTGRERRTQTGGALHPPRQ